MAFSICELARPGKIDNIEVSIVATYIDDTSYSKMKATFLLSSDVKFYTHDLKWRESSFFKTVRGQFTN